ncbi:DUF2283 domain-containing protein [Nocardioides eburneiflavus]|uniref:DUF2283 domain-containing protein n=1 Tax=Nocardioides eburneiflavus TaxID=2518372 RepID=UPI00143D2FC4|nr:DUF2283 domain-containing protein [Nocardioides eburneiflavus]
MRLTYDSDANAAYVYLVDSTAPGGVAQTRSSMLELELASIDFDLDAEGKVLGIEILGASRVLADETLQATQRLSVRISYDQDADAAYVTLVDAIRSDEVERTIPVDLVELGGMINLDFGADGRLLGIAILDASKSLPPEVLRGRT